MVIVPYEEISQRAPTTGNLLDIGCGYGILAQFLSLDSEYRQVLGIDINSGRLKAIKKVLCHSPKNVRFEEARVESINSEEFDCVVMEEVLHHIPKSEQQKMLCCVYRILSKNGLFLLRENNKRFSFRHIFVNIPLEYLLYATDEKANFRTNEELTKMLKEAGFSCEIVPAPWYSLVDTSLFICHRVV